MDLVRVGTVGGEYETHLRALGELTNYFKESKI